MRQRTSAKSSTATTIKEVAAKAGVSTATVSRVLSGQARVGDELRNKVVRAADALKYRPNRAARHLRTGFNNSIAVLIPDIENPFYTSLVRGIEQALQPAGYSLLLADYNESPKQERIYLSQMQADGVAGVLFSASRAPGSAYDELFRSGLPGVAVSREIDNPRVDQVMVDNEMGAKSAISHLISLGHRRIALINGPQSVNTASGRYRGYVTGLREAGIETSDELIAYGDFRQAGGYHAMRTLLAKLDRPTAVFVASNLMTLGALQAIHEKNLRIPEDVALVGFDDMPWAISLRPPLTTVAQPIRELGQTAAHLLLDRIQNPQRPRKHIVLQTRLIVRSSCGSNPHGIAEVRQNSFHSSLQQAIFNEIA